MEITSFKVKSRGLPMLTFPIKNSISGALEVQLMQTQFFWIHYSNIYKRLKFQTTTMSYEGDMSFQR